MERYSRAVTDFYVLSGISEEPKRAWLVGRLANYFGQGDFQALAAGPRMSVGVPNTNAMCRRGRS